jgi:hypothetical protein
MRAVDDDHIDDKANRTAGRTNGAMSSRVPRLAAAPSIEANDGRAGRCARRALDGLSVQLRQPRQEGLIAMARPVAEMGERWPREMRAGTAAAYCDEPSVEAFRAKVDKGIYSSTANGLPPQVASVQA